MNALENIIREEIAQNGPVSVSRYMAQCLGHPEFGYYTTGNPFGAKGDFVTAPEISQIFGEMIGLWLVNQWDKIGRPDDINLFELGPGTGTLMADILRVSRKFSEFNKAINVNLIETSPTLSQIQQKKLASFAQPVLWHESIPENKGKPALYIANELFDALAINQFTKTDIGWSEVMIGLRDNQFAKVQASPQVDQTLSTRFPHLETGRVVECSLQSDTLATQIGNQIRKNGGAALFIDYGAWQGVGDTLQAIKAHKPISIFSNIGMADLTAHVDFSQIVKMSNCFYKFTTQGKFLENMGITARAQSLAGNLEGSALDNLISGHHRLTHPDQMGELFKVLALFPDDTENIAGFAQ